MKHTKIVCTIGPASDTKTTIESMLSAGMNVARLNFSHGTYDDHKELIKTIRTASEETGKTVALLQDLQGPRIRVGDVPVQGIELKRRDKVVFVTPKEYKTYLNDKYIPIPIQYTTLFQAVEKGGSITIQDGLIDLTIERIYEKRIYCRVIQGGVVFSHKGMNAPGAEITGPVITAKDKEDLAFGIKQNVDYVALSFVKNEKDIQKLRSLLPEKKGIQIIAKIERAEAVKNFEKILAEADGIMIARGDLGVELGPAAVPLLQKDMITKTVRAAKPVIVATQMLESMIENPRPTRAEAADVANAIIDHTDAIMLSAESATGQYPVKAVQMMTEIAHKVERSAYDDPQQNDVDHRHETAQEGTAHAAVTIAQDTDAKAIVILCRSGRTARQVAQLRPQKTPIIALTTTDRVLRQLSLVWGVSAYRITTPKTQAEFIRIVKKVLTKNHIVANGERVVVIYGNGRKGSSKSTETVII